MDTRLLIDAIVRQTTVLIAQLSTAAGIRAPLANVADQVFVNLAREIEAQGVGRKVVADMFGLALRTYQKKLNRLTESQTSADTSLWEAVLGFLQQNGSSSRRAILERFHRDDPLAVGAVLNDLTNSGLVYSTGRGDGAVYGLTGEADRNHLARQQSLEAITGLVWMSIYREPGTRDEILERTGFDEELFEQALASLVNDARVQDADGVLRASRFTVPVGEAMGWEAAVFDHFRACATTLAVKVRVGRPSHEDDTVGGATLSFDLHDDHPHRQEVLGLLKRMRRDVNELWERVSAYNTANPVPEAQRTKVYFYFGQYTEDSESEE